MRFKSQQSDGFQVFAVAGINTISFAIEATKAAKNRLQGFAVERIDKASEERYYMYGFKVFPSIIPSPTSETSVSTFDQPVQSFVWDDFTAKDDHEYEYLFHPLKGTPKHLDRSTQPISIRVRTEKLFSSGAHDIFFNRGVASSQAYARRFGNLPPNKLGPKRAEALEWLSRSLDDAILEFIKQAKKGDTLLCCFYEFRYLPVAKALKAAINAEVDVRIIVDAKNNGSDGEDSFPRTDNLKTIEVAGIPQDRIILREARTSAIQHNKFMVLLKGAQQKPEAVWGGSTNISEGGIHGQTNVGHWVRDSKTAAHFRDYWKLLAQDPGAKDGDSKPEVLKANEEFRRAVEELVDVPKTPADIPAGITTVFSPRRGNAVLKLYTELLDTAASSSGVTLAFGINKEFKTVLQDNTSANGPVVFLLLEKEDRPNPRSTNPFVAINAQHNVYKAWGAFIDTPVYQFARETNARILKLNNHVSYIHSKFLLRDPLGEDPIIVTGSANFSTASTSENDENMFIIRGDTRTADIYFTEFNRLFNHYYFRAVVESLERRDGEVDGAAGAFLTENYEWLEKYEPGTLRSKRVKIMTNMAHISTL